VPGPAPKGRDRAAPRRPRAVSPRTEGVRPLRLFERAAARIVLYHAGQIGDDPSAFLPSLRRGQSVAVSEVAELARALPGARGGVRATPARSIAASAFRAPTGSRTRARSSTPTPGRAPSTTGRSTALPRRAGGPSSGSSRGKTSATYPTDSAPGAPQLNWPDSAGRWAGSATVATPGPPIAPRASMPSAPTVVARVAEGHASIPKGGGTALDYAAASQQRPPGSPSIPARFDRVVDYPAADHDDHRSRAGLTLGPAPRHARRPGASASSSMRRTRTAPTLGGIYATNHDRPAAVRSRPGRATQIIGVRFRHRRRRGSSKGGGRVVKNVAGYRLPQTPDRLARPRSGSSPS